MNRREKIGVIGLGYVGLPLALALANNFEGTVGFDLNLEKVAKIKRHVDPTGEGFEPELQTTSLEVSASSEILKGVTFFIVGVPTPIDEYNNPDLRPLLGACDSIGRVLKGGEAVVFESTVYPGVTEEICGPALERVSGLKAGIDFKLGYSPERINPGDREHSLQKVTKVVAGQDADTLERVAHVYGTVVKAGVHRAPSIKVAEAAKVIENTQRDLNIALMNELAIIFDRLGIETRDVLAAAGTKWNFLNFRPGLVGGHCIGVDPYYLTTKAQQVGYHPEVILAGRRINDSMGRYIAQRSVKLLVNGGIQPRGARVGVLGLTFKENVADLRNSRVPDIIRELREFGVSVQVHDPLAESHEAKVEYGIELSKWSELHDLDAIIIAVAHSWYKDRNVDELLRPMRPGGAVIDIKSLLSRAEIPDSFKYWSL